MSNYPDSSAVGGSKAVKKAAPTLNDDGREGGGKYKQDGKASDGQPFLVGAVDVNAAKEVVDPNVGLKPLADMSANAED